MKTQGFLVLSATVFLLGLFTINASAAVYRMNPDGDPLQVENDVVICTSVRKTCTLFISGLPPFSADALSLQDAKDKAFLQCKTYAATKKFVNAQGKVFDPCSNVDGTNNLMHGYSCK